MALDNVSFGLYANVTCGVSGHPPCTEAAPAFDTYMAGVARHPEHFFSQRQFCEPCSLPPLPLCPYESVIDASGLRTDEEAAAGTLPAFSFFSPSWQACDHPCSQSPRSSARLPMLLFCAI